MLCCNCGSNFFFLSLSLPLQAFLVGIVVPDAEVMPGWAQKKGFQGSYAQLCKNVVCFFFMYNTLWQKLEIAVLYFV